MARKHLGGSSQPFYCVPGILVSTPTAQRLPAREPGTEPATAESLGEELRAALPPIRLHSVSLCTAAGDVLWLSEGALGPDEHGFVVDALHALAQDPASLHRQSDFRDGRGALFLAVRSPQSELVGLAMLLVDSKVLITGIAARILGTASLRAILQRIAILLKPPTAPGRGTGRTAQVPIISKPPAAPPPGAAAPLVVPALAASPPASAAKAAPAASTPAAPAPVAAPARSLETIEWSPPDPPAKAPPARAPAPPGSAAAPVAPASAVRPAPPPLSAARGVPTREIPVLAAPPAIPLELHVQELAKLRVGGRLRHYRVLARAAGAAVTGPDEVIVATPEDDPVDSLVRSLRTLIAWCSVHGTLLESAPVKFSLPLTGAVLEVATLGDRIAGPIAHSALPAGALVFEIAELDCIRHRAAVERLVRSLETLGCGWAIDDFTFDSGGLELLRSPALRLVKVDARLIGAALRDKLAQARVVAIAQAVRVLGVHCAAKQVASESSSRWLTAAGFDFAEGPLFDAPKRLEALAADLASSK